MRLGRYLLSRTATRGLDISDECSCYPMVSLFLRAGAVVLELQDAVAPLDIYAVHLAIQSPCWASERSGGPSWTPFHHQLLAYLLHGFSGVAV